MMLKKLILGLITFGLLCGGCALVNLKRVELSPLSQISGELTLFFKWEDRQISMGEANFDTRQFIDGLGGEIFSFSYTLRNEHFTMNLGIGEMPLAGEAYIWVGATIVTDETGSILYLKGACEAWGQQAHMPGNHGEVVGFPVKTGDAKVITPKIDEAVLEKKEIEG